MFYLLSSGVDIFTRIHLQPSFFLRSSPQLDMRSSLDKLIELEKDEFWVESKSPEKEEEFLSCQLDMDIWTVQHCHYTHDLIYLFLFSFFYA